MKPGFDIEMATNNMKDKLEHLTRAEATRLVKVIENRVRE